MMNKFENIRSDQSLQNSIIMILAETWIPETKGNHRIYEMKSFNGHLNNCGRVY